MPQLSLINSPYEVCFSRNPVVYRFKVTPYGSEEIALNTQVAVSLYIESLHYSNLFTEVKRVALVPDAQGFCSIDWSNLIDANLDYEPPAPNNINITLLTKQAKRFYIRYALINNYEQAADAVQSAVFTAFKGGLAIEEYHASNFFTGNIKTSKQFLRFTGDRRETVHISEPLWFHYALHLIFPNSFSATTKVTATATWNNNTTTVKELTLTTNMGNWRLLMAPVGVQQLGLDTNPPAGATFIKYVDVKAERDGITLLSGTYRYYVHYENYYNTRTLHYFNSLGGFDTIVLRGNNEHGGEYEKQQFTRLDTSGFSTQGVIRAQEFNNASFERETIKGNTGWIPKWKAEALRDLLNANLAWENKGTRLKPVVINTASSTLYTNKDNLFNIGIDYKDAFREKNFTPAGIVAGAAGCPDIEFLEVTQGSRPYYYKLSWKLPDGYDRLEFWEYFSYYAAPPAGYSATAIILEGNAGTMELETRFGFMLNSSPYSGTLYYFARVICDAQAIPMVGGAWRVTSAVLYKYPPPIPVNDFGATYKGSGHRQIYFSPNRPVDNDISRLANGIKRSVLFGGTGSAGGNFYFDATYNLFYAPPNADFSGTDSITYYVSEEVSPGLWTDGAPGRIYVTVDNSNGTFLTTGAVYMKLQLRNINYGNSGGAWIKYANVHAQFFKDPSATQVYDITGMSIVFTIQKVSRINGVVGSWSYTGTYFEMYLRNDEIQLQNGEEFEYRIIAGPKYFVL